MVGPREGDKGLVGQLTMEYVGTLKYSQTTASGKERKKETIGKHKFVIRRMR